MVAGILALQGAFAAHQRVLDALGCPTTLVRSAADLDRIDRLVLPGGESTVQRLLLQRLGLEAPLRAFVAGGAPVLATCAGLILLSRSGLDVIDVNVERNAWGRQVESFEATSDGGRPLVFIRAPRIVAVGSGVEVLDRFGGEPVLVREGNVTCATFHPELSSDQAIHSHALHLSSRRAELEVHHR